MPFICGNKCQAIPFDKSIASMEDGFVHLHIFQRLIKNVNTKSVGISISIFGLREENN